MSLLSSISRLRTFIPAVLLALLLLAPSTASAGLTIDEVIKMTNIGVSDAVIVTAIEASNSTFELTPDDIKRLRGANVSADVIGAMQVQEDAEPTTTDTGPAAPTVNAPSVSPEAPSVDASPEQPEAAPVRAPAMDPTTLRPLPGALKDVEKKYKAGKFTSSAVEAYDLLIGANKEKYEDFRPEILYWLAKSLLKLGYVHSAHDLMLTVAKAGPGSRNFSNSLIYLTLTSRKLHDYRGLKQVFSTTAPEDVPAKAKDAYLYLHGAAKYENEDFADALQYLERVSQRSEFFLPAEYLEGLIRYRQGDNTRAARIFREIIEAETVIGNPADIRNVQDMALLNMARIYYRVEDFNRALQLYNLMPRESAYWPRALFEGAYANFWIQDYNYALGQSLTVYSPFYGDRIFMADASILEALIYFNLCEYDRVIQMVDGFQELWTPVRDDLRASNQTLADRPNDAYKALVDEVAGVADIPPGLAVEIRYNVDLQDIERHLRMLENEMNLLGEESVRWRNSPLGTQLNKLLARDKEILESEAGQVVLDELGRLERKISSLIGESDIIEFEVLSAQKDTFEEKFRNPEFVETYEELEYSYATESRYIYWPFTGEFWKDELGYYRFTEAGSCKR